MLIERRIFGVGLVEIDGPATCERADFRTHVRRFMCCGGRLRCGPRHFELGGRRDEHGRNSARTSAEALQSTESTVSPSTLYGVSLSPRSYEADDFAEFFELARLTGGVVRWAGDWAELGDRQGGAVAIAELQAKFGYTPVFEANIFRQDPTPLLRPLSEPQIAEYVRLARQFAEDYSPPYFGLGIEINMLYESVPEDFEKFVGLFDMAAAAIHEASPGTLVFTSFQLERMHGLAGGLWGGDDDTSTARWHLLERFPEADLFSFTTYPVLNYTDPRDIPVSHYLEVLEHTSKPVAFTEIGWPAGTIAPGWESSQGEQAAAAQRLLELIAPLDSKLVLWSFMFDPAGDLPAPFLSMGLVEPDGTKRQAFYEWQSAAVGLSE